MDQDLEKPPTQSVGAVGFNAFSAKVPNTAKLCRHPPFQAYIEELQPNIQGIPSDRYAAERAAVIANAMGNAAFIDSYIAWWGKKGCWTGEDPLGGA